MAALDDVIQPCGDGKLSVIAAGGQPPNPSELLGSAHMSSMLQELRDSHDYVIIDAPPLLPVTDAAVLAVQADGAVIVTKYGFTKRDQLRTAAETLQAIEARHLGTILNMVPQKTVSYGYGYEPDAKRQGGSRGGQDIRIGRRSKTRKVKDWREY